MKEQEIINWINNGKEKQEALVWFNRRRTLALYLIRGGILKEDIGIGILNFLELPQSSMKRLQVGRQVAFLKDVWIQVTDKEHYREFIGQFMKDDANEPETWTPEKIDTLFEYFRLGEIAKKNKDNPFFEGPAYTVTDWRGTISDAIFVNMNATLRTGGRKAPRMTVDEFKEAIAKKKETHKKAIKEFSLDNPEPGYINDWILDLGTELDWKWVKDVQKVQFDFENRFISDDVKVSPTKGIPYFECWAGGDWQDPLYFFLYWDGKDIRGYVPTKGNTFNATLGCAFGEEHEFLPDEDQRTEADWKKEGGYIVAAQNFPDFVASGKTAEEINNAALEYGLMNRIRVNMAACLEDFEERIDIV